VSVGSKPVERDLSRFLRDGDGIVWGQACGKRGF
jgi:hypothetical protein